MNKKTKNFLIFAKEAGSDVQPLEYTLKIKQKKGITKYELFYSNCEHWTYPGELVMTLTDNGNTCMISTPDLLTALDDEFNYDEMACMQILLKAYRKHNKELKYKFSQVKN